MEPYLNTNEGYSLPSAVMSIDFNESIEDGSYDLSPSGAGKSCQSSCRATCRGGCRGCLGCRRCRSDTEEISDSELVALLEGAEI